MDWSAAFFQSIGEAGGTIGWGEMSLRALIIFVFGVLATRIGAWRAFGRWSSPDIIVAIIIGSNLSRALTGPAPLLPTMAATAVFIAAYWLLSLAASRSPALDRLVKGQAVALIVNGKIDEEAVQRSALSRRDLDEALRHKGVTEHSSVVKAMLERNGTITVIRREDVR